MDAKDRFDIVTIVSISIRYIFFVIYILNVISPVEAAELPSAIFNNDMTNWDRGPFNEKFRIDDKSKIEQIQNSIDKSLSLGFINGINAQSLSVHYSVFPWWIKKSSLYSFEDHDRFLRSLKYFDNPSFVGGYPGAQPSKLRVYEQLGNDIIEHSLNYQQSRGMRLRVLNFRMNDYHYNWNYSIYKNYDRSSLELLAASNKSPICDGSSLSVFYQAENWTQTAFTSYFDAFNTGTLDPKLNNRCVSDICLHEDDFKECNHNSCLLNKNTSQCPIINLNFGSQIVRKFVLMQIIEVISGYKPDYIELDFDRYPMLFADDISDVDKANTITSMLRDIASYANRVSPTTKIGLRVPSKSLHRRYVGIDLQKISDGKLASYVIYAMPYLSDQQIDYGINPAKSNFAAYAEVTHSVGGVKPPSIAQQSREHLLWRDLLKPSQMLTAAHLAFEQGSVGMAFFNMHYYQIPEYKHPAIKMPYSAISCATLSSCVADTDQSYFLSSAHYGLKPTDGMLPLRLDPRARSTHFKLLMRPPKSGWAPDVHIRLSLESPITNSDVSIYVNDHPAQKSIYNISDFDLPIDDEFHSYDRKIWYKSKEYSFAFLLNSSLIQDGLNDVYIWNKGESPIKIINFEIVAKKFQH